MMMVEDVVEVVVGDMVSRGRKVDQSVLLPLLTSMDKDGNILW